MTPIFPQLPRALGGYTLTRLLLVGPETELYEASQTHMNRPVIIEVLRPGLPREREAAFLNRARLCAAAELPHVPRVVETLMAEGVWFIAGEMPEGRTLAEIHASGARLSPIQICDIVEAAAEVYTMTEKAELATMALTPYSIFLNDAGKPSFLPPIRDGEIQEGDTACNMQYLAAVLEPLRPVNVEGENRVLSILQWLREGYEGQPVAWDTFTYVCGIVREQLSTGTENNPENSRLSEARTKRHLHRLRRKLLRALGFTVLALAAIGGLSWLGTLYPQGEQPTLPAVHNGMLAAKRHGSTQHILMRPVSIREYEHFINSWKLLSEDEKAAINRNIPDTCGEHIPGDWEQQLAAAANKGQYAGMELTPDSPVRNVSYWDALAYTRFSASGATLPDAAQLQAVHKAGGASKLSEWSATVAGDGWLGIYPDNAPLLMDMAHDARPLPAPDYAYRSPKTGFRIVLTSLDK